jgi:hypothetical protein
MLVVSICLHMLLFQTCTIQTPHLEHRLKRGSTQLVARSVSLQLLAKAGGPEVLSSQLRCWSFNLACNKGKKGL